MTFGLVNASFSLPEWQAVKMTFFAPCPWSSLSIHMHYCRPKVRSVSSHLEQTSMVDTRFIIWQKQRLTLIFSCEEEEGHPKSILPPWVANKNAGIISFCRLMELAIFKWINPFAPGDFTEKRVLKPVEWFSGPVVLWRAMTHHKAVYRSYNSRPSDGMRRKQNFEAVFEFKSETAVLTFTFRFLSSPFFRFSCLMLFFSCWASSRLHFGGKRF